MPYYCTVPRCTSMAGKAKNVSFHQFPRDEELAVLWNKILKRGKPYTKYSKVCSLHFKPDDYTVTNVGKNKGHWRTLRKDAIPSQNLPPDSSMPYQRGHSDNWIPSSKTPNLVNPEVQHVARAIYMQTILAMQAATASDALSNSTNSIGSESPRIGNPLLEPADGPQTSSSSSSTNESSNDAHDSRSTSYKCDECLRCFKDPDVFILHRRTHTKSLRRSIDENGSEKENLNLNSSLMLQANPILANMLNRSHTDSLSGNDNSHLVTALALNFSSYMNSLSTIVNCDTVRKDCDNNSLDESKLVIDETV